MLLLLGLLIFSFVATGILIVPFINLLYRLRFQRQEQITRDAFGRLTPIFNRFHAKNKISHLACIESAHRSWIRIHES